MDLAAKSKLFSILVDDLEAAQQVLAINKEIKGGVIKIFTFETMEHVPLKQPTHAYPPSVKPLIDFVSAKDPRVAKLVNNIFCKVVLAKEYETALQVAKSHDLTCVTPQLQVVYAGAFITRVGSSHIQTADSRLGLYQQISKLKDQLAQAEAEKTSIEADQEGLNNSDLEALRKLQKAELQLTRLKDELQQLKAAKFELQSQLNGREQKRIALDDQLLKQKNFVSVLNEQEHALQKERVSAVT